VENNRILINIFLFRPTLVVMNGFLRDEAVINESINYIIFHWNLLQRIFTRARALLGAFTPLSSIPLKK
jgi:hypothetical protein